MEKEVASADEIRKVIESRLNAEQALMKDHAMVQVQLPQHKAPDADGCNWHVDFVGDITGHEDVISRILTDIQGRYQLRE